MTTTTIRYNYVFAFIHYYCLTALSASLFRCANVHCCTKRFSCGRSLNSAAHKRACRTVAHFDCVHIFDVE